jgi:hypothetical protein
LMMTKSFNEGSLQKYFACLNEIKIKNPYNLIGDFPLFVGYDVDVGMKRT